VADNYRLIDSGALRCAVSYSSTMLSLRGCRWWPYNERKSSGFVPSYKSTSPPAGFICQHACAESFVLSSPTFSVSY
jgi:hypothetical protein